jgi:hypothetical protein
MNETVQFFVRWERINFLLSNSKFFFASFLFQFSLALKVHLYSEILILDLSLTCEHKFFFSSSSSTLSAGWMYVRKIKTLEERAKKRLVQRLSASLCWISSFVFAIKSN